MAQVNVERKTEKVTKVIETEVTTVLLRLSEPEARALSLVLTWVGGAPDYTARKHTQSILEGLRDRGYDYKKSKCIVTGSITFLPGSLEAME